MASAAVHVMAAVKSSPDLREADISVSLIPLAIDFKAGVPRMHKMPGPTIDGNCMQPDSRGEIRLASTDPHAKPLIDHRLLGDERDMAQLIPFAKLQAKIFKSEPSASHVVGDNFPAYTPQNDTEWEALIRETAGIGYHPSGTCYLNIGSTTIKFQVICDLVRDPEGGFQTCSAKLLGLDTFIAKGPPCIAPGQRTRPMAKQVCKSCRRVDPLMVKRVRYGFPRD